MTNKMPTGSAIERSLISPAPRKRQREAQEDDESIAMRSKKPKRHQTAKKGAKSSTEDFDIEKGLNNAIAKMDSQLLADFVAQQIRRYCGDLSTVELQDMYLPASAFRDTSSWSTTRTTENLPQFLTEHSGMKSKGLLRAPKVNGSPHTIVVTSAGLRAADLTRALRGFQSTESSVMKLFAKHIKLRDATEQVKKTRMGIGIGTPQRLIDLLDANSLHVDELVTIVVDGSHIDQKRRGIFNMKEILFPLMKLLNRQEIRDSYGDDSRKIQILVF